MAVDTAVAKKPVAAKSAAKVAASGQRQKEIIAYVFPQNRVLAPDEVAATELTRVNYAFTNLKDGVMVEGFTRDKENFEVLNALKTKNPRLQVVPSVGGWTWSGQFSDMSLTRASRTKFIDSVVLFIEKYKLDGLDIDWEYPAQRGFAGDPGHAGNVFRPEDKHNYTLLLMELRQRLDVEGRKLHRHLVTSIATGSGLRFLDNTEMDKVAKYVDSVNLMTYDMYGPGDKNTGHDSPLYNNPADPKGDRADSVDWSVRLYEKAGVPASKIVVGVPFYSKRWSGVEATNNGLFQAAPPAPRRAAPATPAAVGAAAPAAPPRPASTAEHGYGAMVGMLTQGYVRYWDPVAKAPYLYNPGTKVWITYEDTESLLDKGDYVMDHKLGGIMFWEYTNDPSGMLLKAVNVGLHPEVEAPSAKAKAPAVAKASVPAKAAPKGQ